MVNYCCIYSAESTEQREARLTTQRVTVMHSAMCSTVQCPAREELAAESMSLQKKEKPAWTFLMKFVHMSTKLKGWILLTKPRFLGDATSVHMH